MLIPHTLYTDTIHGYSMTVMAHVKALQAGHSSQGISEPMTPVYNQSAVAYVPIYMYFLLEGMPV